MAEIGKNAGKDANPKADRRLHERSRTFLGGRIILRSGEHVPCILRDISFSGAKLSLSRVDCVPELVELHVERLDRRFYADVRWRARDLIGVQFRCFVDWKSPGAFAYVVGRDPAERWAASVNFKRYGYLVHQSETVEEAALSILALGPLHPMLQNGHPILFAVADEHYPPVSLAQLRTRCPMLYVILASDESNQITGIADALIPRRFTAPQIREVLEKIAPEVVTHC